MEQERDLRYYWRILSVRKRCFIWSALSFFAVITIVTLIWPPTYESKSTILIEEQQVPPEYVKTTVTGYADQRIQSLNQQILSRTRLLEIIRQFDLYAKMREKYTVEEVIEKMRKDITVDLIGVEVSDRKKGRATGTKGVTIAFTVAYQGREPDTVLKVAGTLASLYLQENLKIREQQAKTTTQFLEAELKEIKERIQTIGQQISEFKAKHEGILPELQQFNLSQAERLEKEIDQHTEQIKAAEDRKIYLEGQLATVKPDTPLISSTGERVMDPASRLRVLQVTLCDLQSRYSGDHPDIGKVKREMGELEKLVNISGGSSSLKRQKLTQLKAELAQRQGRYSDQHPEVIKLKKEIAGLEKVPEATGPPAPVAQPENPAYVNLITNIQKAANDISTINRQKAELKTKLNLYRKRLEETPKVEQEYLALTRDYKNAHDKHQEVMNKILESRIAQGMEESQKAEKFTLIDPAIYPEEPVSPKRLLIILAGFLMSGFIGLGMVALTEHLDQSIRNAEELAWLTGFPVLGSIARIVTTEDLARKNRRRRLIWSFTGLSLLVVFVLFHFFIMDLWILTARIGQIIGKHT